MSDFTEKVRVMLDGITKGSWTLDEYGRIMVGHDQLLVHGVAIPCGNYKDLSKAKANGMLLFNAPTLLREACERIEALEKVAYHAWQYCECMRPDREKKHVEYHPEYHFRQNLAKALEELSALDAADAEEK